MSGNSPYTKQVTERLGTARQIGKSKPQGSVQDAEPARLTMLFGNSDGGSAGIFCVFVVFTPR